MNIQVLSDIHLEFYMDQWHDFIDALDPSDVDVLILAGDICQGSKIEEVLKAFTARYKNLVFVPGNHEFYGFKLVELQHKISQISIPNVYTLNGSAVTIEGQRFVGGTLWFKAQAGNEIYQRAMSDFSLIKNFVPEVYHVNERQVQWLEDNLESTDIVVTHHLPTKRSVSRWHRGSQLNRFFVCDLFNLIKDKQPKLWAHGHTHDSCDYMIENTRVICNPYGYYGHELNREFNKELVVSV